jgi:transcriptional regulator with XRE-family HTH domain
MRTETPAHYLTPAAFRAGRLAMGLTQEQLSEQLGPCREVISKIENGHSVITRTMELAFDRLMIRDIVPLLGE